MSWVKNKLEKTTEVTITPGSPAVPSSPGTAGSPAYSYLKPINLGTQTFVSNSPPSGWDNEIVIPLPGGGTQTIQSGGYRYFGGVKAYLSAILFGVEYVYRGPAQTIYERVYVDAVEPVPATPGRPAVQSERIEAFNFGWNSGAHGPATLAVNKVFTWKMATSNVGAIVGLTLSVDPQDNGYTGMQIGVMGQSGQYQIYRNGTPITGLSSYSSGDTFAFKRTNIGTIEIYKSGGLIHTESLPADIIVDSSLYSGGDVIWDAQEQDAILVPLNSEIESSTASNSGTSDIAGSIAVTQTIGPGTALGVAGATTTSAGINGSVKVNGAVNVSIGETSEQGGTGGGMTRTVSMGVAEAIGAVKTFGTGTALGTIASSTLSASAAEGDPETGVGVSTNVGAGDMSMYGLTAAGSGPNVYTGWTGNFQGDNLSMEPLDIEASGGLAAPTIGEGFCVMPPMDASVTGLTGETTVVPGDVVITEVSGIPTFPAMIEVSGSFGGGSVIIIDYTPNNLGNQTITYVVPAGGQTAEEVAAGIAALIEAQTEVTATAVGTTIELEPVAPSTIILIDGIQVLHVNGSFLWMAMFASSEVTYAQGQLYMHPMMAQATDDPLDDLPQLNTIDVTEAFTIASPTQVNFVNKVIETVHIGLTVQTFYNPSVDLAEEILATTYQQTAFVLQIAEQFNVTDETSATQVVAIAEALLMTGSVQTLYQGVVSVLSSMIIEDAVIPAYSTTVSDNILLTDATLETILRVANIIESMTIATAFENTLTVIVEETLNATIEDNIELTARYLVDVLEHADVYAMIKTPSELAQGWVMNTEAGQPISEYSNYNFNSMDWFDGVMYGCNDDGLYKMGADDDAGDPITAEVSSLMLDMGTSRMKRIRSAYLGYTSTNELVMKVKSVSQGQLSEHWYKASRAATADAPEGSYMAVGQGLKSRYWQFELTNIDGGDFEIDLVELHPLVLNRRV